MFKVANNILKNESDAEDAVNEAFFRIARDFSKIRNIHNKQSRKFAIVIVENIAKNIYDNKRDKAEDNIDDFDDLWDDGDLENDIEIKASVEVIQNALRMLPDRYYSVLYMTLNCGYTITETSTLLGLTRENTKKIYARAKRKIKEIAEAETHIYE
jgi:RNA polymerase sigma-70 factor (ECF subfamily)